MPPSRFRQIWVLFWQPVCLHGVLKGEGHNFRKSLLRARGSLIGGIARLSIGLFNQFWQNFIKARVVLKSLFYLFAMDLDRSLPTFTSIGENEGWFHKFPQQKMRKEDGH